MMIENDKAIAKKYAVAYFQLFKVFLKKNRQFAIYLSIPSVSIELRKKTIATATRILQFDASIIHLIETLLLHKRIYLLETVCDTLAGLYRTQHNIIKFKITSSHLLTTQDIALITDFIHDNIDQKNSIETEFVTNKSLIAGVKIQSETLMWECSVVQQLKSIKQSILQQVGL